MIRETTQVHTFFMPFDLSNIKDIYVTYVQNEQEIIEKSIEDISFEHQRKAITKKNKSKKSVISYRFK